MQNDGFIQTVPFLGLRFDRMTPEHAVQVLLDGAISRQSRRVYFANAHTVNCCYHEPALREALLGGDLLLAEKYLSGVI